MGIEADGPGSYTYCRGNPVGLKDPSGTDAESTERVETLKAPEAKPMGRTITFDLSKAVTVEPAAPKPTLKQAAKQYASTAPGGATSAAEPSIGEDVDPDPQYRSTGTRSSQAQPVPSLGRQVGEALVGLVTSILGTSAANAPTSRTEAASAPRSQSNLSAVLTPLLAIALGRGRTAGSRGPNPARVSTLVSTKAPPAPRTVVNVSPTVAELRSLGPVKGFQVHHILPEYLGKMLGYTSKDMLAHPGTFISQWSHTGRLNPAAMHKAISRYLPPMVNGRKATYTPAQIEAGLKKAYGDLGRPDLFGSVEPLITRR